ncbi:elongation factor 1-gamma-like [Cebus imitator]|uniref:elongation factor 1-gamma-like n=1 Tax=Cebus imitator TaxID=2715852 RepID=UPI00189743CD|nr:elongation factor 1-gamma-like [Cebus imitator]
MNVSRRWPLNPRSRTPSLTCSRVPLCWMNLSASSPVMTHYAALPYFWEHFDKDSWSLRYSEYPFPEELTQTFMSCNLIIRMFQRLDKLRKNAFASVILFGTNNSSSISGIRVFQGKVLAFPLSPDWQVDYESYTWPHPDPGSEETQTLVREHFSWEGAFQHVGSLQSGQALQVNISCHRLAVCTCPSGR